MKIEHNFKKLFAAGMVYSFIFITVVSSSVFYSCSKGFADAPEEDYTQIINNYRQALSKDEDFIKNFQVDKILSGYLRDSMERFEEKSYQRLLREVSNAKREKDLIVALNNYGHSDAESLVSFFIEKSNALSKVKSKYPKLSNLSQAEFNQLFMESYRSVSFSSVTIEHAPGCTTNCCDAYVRAANDCDISFAIATGLTLFGAGIATFTATPVAGAATLTAGIAGAYLDNMRCMATAASGYRSCRGYQ
jgi:hypothetical protein